MDVVGEFADEVVVMREGEIRIPGLQGEQLTLMAKVSEIGQSGEREFVVVFDAQTFKEVKRLPMSKPVGKYNVWNKITRSEGTSH